MKNAKSLLLFAALLAVPATGSAQELTRFSMGIGLAAQPHPASWSGFGVGFAHQPRSEGVFPGPGAFSHGSSRASWHGYRNGHHGYGHHGGWSPHDCWDDFWYDPWFACHRHVFAGYPVFGWWYPHPVWWWSVGFPGWPPPGFVGYHWFSFGPVWYDGWDRWHPRHHGRRYHHSHRYGYRGYDRGGYLTPRGYRPGGRAKSRGGSGDRIARGSPLFGPRYKEDPRSNATRNDRGRPVSRAVPRGSRASAGEGDGGRRPGKTTTTRRPRPRDETKPATTRAAPPKLRTRPGAPPRTRATPTRVSRPKARPATSSRPKPTVRKTPTRRTTPKVRPTTRKRPDPVTRTGPTRRAAPKAKAPARSRPTSGARRAPSRTPAPKARPTTSGRSSPKVRPAPAGRPPPKASAPRRPASKARPAPRRSGTSKPPPRRGGKS